MSDKKKKGQLKEKALNRERERKTNQPMRVENGQSRLTNESAGIVIACFEKKGL